MIWITNLANSSRIGRMIRFARDLVRLDLSKTFVRFGPLASFAIDIWAVGQVLGRLDLSKTFVRFGPFASFAMDIRAVDQVMGGWKG